ncbi:hypothetical protein YPC_0031 [Yersinia pestis biovar Medievalis str. Harbin 35]|nr:hypothetical protein YPC_0031 [Yersinia pestis biovar Medievalis str. Harbin 35]EEO74940.1 hypothetical protein YP516_4557 [Yersinia pestis Nepal516]EEO79525.1 hypothetical protein YPF_4458 [Yersinia pestis biovar Orientalis str. India 195]EEO85809.1 hypothetical protein YPH_1678 [Yersinia pestis biovar Orientalis str. PEXU2]EEO91593.1 hypothetical protein YPS_1376 [Yersinia pestis Pestoides A]
MPEIIGHSLLTRPSSLTLTFMPLTRKHKIENSNIRD